MKTVENRREVCPLSDTSMLVIYRMRRVIAGETIGIDTAFTEKEIRNDRPYVAWKLRDSRRRLMQVTAHLRERIADAA